MKIEETEHLIYEGTDIVGALFPKYNIDALSIDFNPSFVKRKPKQPEYARKKCKSCKHFQTVCGNSWSATGKRRKSTNSACGRYVSKK